MNDEHSHHSDDVDYDAMASLGGFHEIGALLMIATLVPAGLLGAFTVLSFTDPSMKPDQTTIPWIVGETH